MDRHIKRAILLFLAAVSITGATFLSPKQAAEPGSVAASGVMSITPAGSNLRQYTAGGHVLGFREDGVTIASGSHALKVEFLGARQTSPVAAGTPSEPKTRQNHAPALGRVSYRELWEGVTADYEKTESAVVKSTYHIQAGVAGMARAIDGIRLRYNVPVKVDANGNLVMTFSAGEMRESRPVAWQEIAGARVPVKAAYRLLSDREVGFAIGPHDPRSALVIDPTMTWNTFLGTSAEDQGYAIAADAYGNSYVTGYSYATWGEPVRPFYGDPGFANAFVAKLDRNGGLVWNTFLGDIDMAQGNGIAVDANGYLYVVGGSSTWWDAEGDTRDNFPGADGTSNVFVAKLGLNGALLWHRFLGGTGEDYGQGIALDAAGNSYVAGTSYTTWGAPLQAYIGGAEAFAAKLDVAGNLLWNTFMGQANIDFGRGIGTDANGNAYVTGHSYATWGSPVTPWHGSSGIYDAFVAKLDTNGYRVWNTFVGGTQYDHGFGIVADAAGNSYLTGYSWSTWGTPVRAFGGGGRDAFVAKLNTTGQLQWNTFLGGTLYDYGNGIARDANGNIYATGLSSGTWGTPIRPYSGDDDAFVAKLDASGNLLWNGFLGSIAEDCGMGVAADPGGSAYVAGYSDWTWGSPVRSFEPPDEDAAYDAFVARIGGGARVDFNKDGQEDILWRYQGTGGFQGLVLAWLMDQTQAAAPTPQAASQTEPAPSSLLTGAPSGSSSRLPRAVTIPRTTFKAPRASFKYVMLDGKAPSLTPDRIMRNPMDAGGERSAKGRKRLIAGDSSGLPELQAEPVSVAAEPETVELASLALGAEVVIAAVQDTGWEIAGTGDLDGDSDTDIVWRYYGAGALLGLNDIWLMNGTSFVSESIFSVVTDTAWRIVGTGDFNGDGKTDILWRYHGTGTYQGLNVIWHMNGTAFQSEVVFSQIADTAWRIVGTGDFNGDGKTDILWRYHGTGALQGLNVVWFMNGTVITGESVFSQVLDTTWEIAGTGDFDGDGNADILWRNYGVGGYQGMSLVWYMDGTTFLSEEIFGVVADTNWRIVNR